MKRNVVFVLHLFFLLVLLVLSLSLSLSPICSLSPSLSQMLGGYGDFLYQTGLIDMLQKQYVEQQTASGVQLIQQEKWVEAFEVRH